MPESEITREEKIVSWLLRSAKEVIQEQALHLGQIGLDEDVMGEEVEGKEATEEPA